MALEPKILSHLQPVNLQFLQIFTFMFALAVFVESPIVRLSDASVTNPVISPVPALSLNRIEVALDNLIAPALAGVAPVAKELAVVLAEAPQFVIVPSVARVAKSPR